MTDELFSVVGKIVLVTGGTSGIGNMIAQGFVSRGARTYITGRDLARTQEAAAKLAASGGECIGLAADLTASDGPKELIDQLKALETKLDVLVNNAGGNAKGPIADTTPDDWDFVMELNVRAPFFLIQQALPLLRAAASPERHATIINVGSIGGLHIPNWEAHPYNTSKAAVHHMTRSLGKKLGADQIRVNAIAPGPFPSGMTDTSLESVQKSIATYVPVGRAGTPEDAQGACIFLASRAGAYVNGSVIPLDGGYIGSL